MLRTKLAVAAALLIVTTALRLLAADPKTGDIDWQRAKQLYQKSQSGQSLTPDEQAYLDRAKQARQSGAGQNAAPQRKPAKPPVGLNPLCDMSADDKYKGEDGGLYGGGKNVPPEKHLQAALTAIKLIVPRGVDGQPAGDGKIGLVSIGMSNTTMEFSTFMQAARGDAEKSAKVVLVDGAQGGMDARAWAEPAATNPQQRRDPWSMLDQRLREAGVDPKQVQVAWIKQARANPAALGEYPKHAEAMDENLIVAIHKLKERFPNLRIAYLSSRIYAGYASTMLNPEPYAYEGAFAVRKLIQDQIKGDERLRYESNGSGSAVAPLLLWGQYLWADGEKGRKLDSLVWKPEDFGGDGTHPSASGRQKVADLLLNFFKTDPTAKPWFTTGK